MNVWDETQWKCVLPESSFTAAVMATIVQGVLPIAARFTCLPPHGGKGGTAVPTKRDGGVKPILPRERSKNYSKSDQDTSTPRLCGTINARKPKVTNAGQSVSPRPRLLYQNTLQGYLFDYPGVWISCSSSRRAHLSPGVVSSCGCGTLRVPRKMRYPLVSSISKPPYNGSRKIPE